MNLNNPIREKSQRWMVVKMAKHDGLCMCARCRNRRFGSGSSNRRGRGGRAYTSPEARQREIAEAEVEKTAGGTPLARSWETQDETDTTVTKVNAGLQRSTGQDTTEFLLLQRDGSEGRHIVLSADDGDELYNGPHHNR